MSELGDRFCQPCRGDTPQVAAPLVERYLRSLPGWQLAEDGTAIERHYEMTNFVAALAFLNDVGGLAEAEGHHPDLHLTGYRHVRLVLATHAIGGLSENDFILAAKIDRLRAPR
ncbi:MAG: 4a-hydroxytetrahydrobiopterin dehydratase [Planctomycetota bacterium]